MICELEHGHEFPVLKESLFIRVILHEESVWISRSINKVDDVSEDFIGGFVVALVTAGATSTSIKLKVHVRLVHALVENTAAVW